MKGEVKIPAKGRDLLSCRDVLWCLVFCGFAINAMLLDNLSLAIIAMVEPRPKAVVAAQCTYDLQMPSNLSNLWVNASSVTNFNEHNVTQISVSSLEPTAELENTTPEIPERYHERFDWSEYEQGLALGGVFWLNWATQIPGGVLAHRYGTKLVFGLANLASALLGFLLPLCAHYHLYAFVALRVGQGLIAGLVWPSMHDMTAKWIPISERSKFISSYTGSSVGTALTYPLCAMLLNWFSWDSIFYTTSGLGVIWYVAWYYLAYDTPQEHPRISEAEQSYIVGKLGNSVGNVNSQSVPWRAILTSRALWITTIAAGGASWGTFTIALEAPTYLHLIHGWDTSATGVLSAGPHVMRMLFSYVFARFADWLLRTKRMSTTNLRKFAMFVCNGVQSVLLLGLAFSGCHPNWAITFMIGGIGVSGALTAGTLAGCIDLSPNYGSIIFGIASVTTVLAGFISPLIVGVLTNNNQTIEQWRLVYFIAVAIIFSTGALYVLFGTAELQPWNNPGNEAKGEELQKLRSNLTEVECEKTPDVISEKWLKFLPEEHRISNIGNFQSR